MMSMKAPLLLALAGLAAAAAPCVIRPDTQIVYSKAQGVGGSSIIWV